VESHPSKNEGWADLGQRSFAVRGFVVPAPSQRTRRNGALSVSMMSAKSKGWAARLLENWGTSRLSPGFPDPEAPAFVQNRCYARLGWDREVRRFCREREIVYRGFSLLTANKQVLRDAVVTELAAGAGATPAQVVFAFARAVGMLPLTGTSDAEHMRQDLASSGLTLSEHAVREVEGLVG
jgi:hypothetical protein